MITAITSILILTPVIWLMKKKLKFEVCPICAGTTLTWLWMLIGIILGKLSVTNYQLPTALLMGGTVVGLMSRLESLIKPKFVLIWKTIFVVSGFATAYNLIFTNWVIFSAGVALTVASTLLLKTPTNLKENEKSEQAKELEEKMKNCC